MSEIEVRVHMMTASHSMHVQYRDRLLKENDKLQKHLAGIMQSRSHEVREKQSVNEIQKR